MSILIILGSIQLSRMKTAMNQIIDVYNQKTELAFSMRDAIRVRSMKLLNISLLIDPFERDEELQKFYREAARFRDAREKYLALGLDAEEQAIDKRLVERVRYAEPITNEILENIIVTSDYNEINRLLHTVMDTQPQVLAVLDELVELQRSRSTIAADGAKDEYRATIAITSIVGLFALALSMIVTRIVTNYVSRAYQQLQENNAELERATQVKSQFLATMSHEIRTPLNGVIGMTSLLRETPLTDLQRTYAQTISNSSETLLYLVNDILDFSKIEAGKIVLEQNEFDIVSLVDETLDIMSARAHEKDLEILAQYLPGVAGRYIGDPGRIKQILLNLISNAIKFTEHGSVIVTLKIETRSERDAMLRIEVKDTGIGIQKEDQESLFQMFTQIDGRANRKYSGTGLGLAITKQLAKLMNGNVGVESEHGRGSLFWVTVKLAISEQSAKSEIFGFNNRNVLVIDRNSESRNALCELLTSIGIVPKQAVDGHDAMQLLTDSVRSNISFDAILADSTSAEIDGELLVDCLSRDVRFASVCFVPIIKSTDVQCYDEKSAQYVIRKPFVRSNILETLSQCFNVQSAKQRPLDLDLQNDVKFSNRNVLVAEDNAVNQLVVQGMLRKLNLVVDVVADGQSAIQAIKSKHYDLVFMDCQMPVLDGYEASKKIREMTNRGEINYHVPIVALTANALAGDREMCIAAGMDDFLAKPVKLELLTEIVNTWLTRSSKDIKRSTSNVKR